MVIVLGSTKRIVKMGTKSIVRIVLHSKAVNVWQDVIRSRGGRVLVFCSSETFEASTETILATRQYDLGVVNDRELELRNHFNEDVEVLVNGYTILVPANTTLFVSMPQDMVECSACLEQVLRTTVIDNIGDCQHYYCEGCIGDMVRLALRDRSTYPPSCCGVAFTHETVLLHLATDLAAEYESKLEEYDDLRPAYCHDPACSKYLGASDKKDNTGTCSACKTSTCLRCRKVGHHGDCSMKNEDDELQVLADREGWQACRRCERVVEKSGGCNHITCVCKSQFCYVCGATWKTCSCPQFDDDEEIPLDQREDRDVIMATMEIERFLTRNWFMLQTHEEEVLAAGDEAGIDLRGWRDNITRLRDDLNDASTDQFEARQQYERDDPELFALTRGTNPHIDRLAQATNDAYNRLRDAKLDFQSTELQLRRAGRQAMFDLHRERVQGAIEELGELLEAQRQRLTEEERLAVLAPWLSEALEDLRMSLAAEL